MGDAGVRSEMGRECPIESPRKMGAKVQGEGQCKKHFKVITRNGTMRRGDSDNEEVNSRSRSIVALIVSCEVPNEKEIVFADIISKCGRRTGAVGVDPFR